MTIETSGNESTSCCSRVRSWGCLGWFLGPITYDFGLTCCTILYFFFMVPLSLGLSIYTAVTYGVFTGLTALFCIGLILLYINSEIVIGIVRFLVLAPAYGLLECDKANTEQKVYMAVQNGMPLCNTCCRKGSKLARPKFIFTSSKFYKMIFYNILVAPVCTWVFGSTVILVSAPLYLMHHVFRYPFNTKWYKNKHECYGNQTGSNNHCQGWLIDNYGDCIALFLIGFLLLPLVLRLVNNSGQICKKVMYYFLTNYYNPKTPRILNNYSNCDDDDVVTRGTVQLNDQYNVQFVSGNNNYHSTDTDNDLVTV